MEKHNISLFKYLTHCSTSLAQVLYAYSQDCSRRLLIKAPKGDAAKRIRLQTGEEVDLTEKAEAGHELGEEPQDFILPNETVIERLDLIRKQL